MNRRSRELQSSFKIAVIAGGFFCNSSVSPDALQQECLKNPLRLCRLCVPKWFEDVTLRYMGSGSYELGSRVWGLGFRVKRILFVTNWQRNFFNKNQHAKAHRRKGFLLVVSSKISMNRRSRETAVIVQACCNRRWVLLQ